MFTGIVEEIGTILVANTGLERDNTLRIGCTLATSDAQLGDSIAVNGVCLTVTAFAADWFEVGLAPETLRRTNLGQLKVGSSVNLERALAAGRRMGGHYVQGHVDGTGEIIAIEPDGESKAITIRVAPALMRYIVEKGFIAVDGTSLTITRTTDDSFGLAIIAHTQAWAIIGQQQVGDTVNIEVDILAKYVENIVRFDRKMLAE
ncbi:MAG TPA: riboflavin synthase [Herpetosiphon sp.]|nr:riboflavin synthase [Herpetosiphon sp.]HBW51048.1 riboflavin synthase [Herpetosiphon sp.]